MRARRPPKLPTWLLRNCTLLMNRDAIVGDLLEEFWMGRSAGWYWRQVAAAIVTGCTRMLRSHKLALLFAIFWCFIPQSFMGVYFLRSGIFNGHFMDTIYSLDWPYSTILSLGLFFGLDILSLWIGLTLSLLADAITTRVLHAKALRRGMWISMIAYLPLRTLVGVLPILHGQSVDWRHMSNTQLMLDPKLLIFRLPYLLCLLFSVWGALSVSDSRIRRRLL